MEIETAQQMIAAPEQCLISSQPAEAGAVDQCEDWQATEKVLLSPAAADALIRTVVFHESGHCTLAKRFGVRTQAHIEFGPAGEFFGVRLELAGKLTFRQSAALCWGGIVAEYLSGYVLYPVPGIPTLTPQSLPDWVESVLRAGLVNWFDLHEIELSGHQEADAGFALQTLSSQQGHSLLYSGARALESKLRKGLTVNGRLSIQISPESPYLSANPGLSWRSGLCNQTPPERDRRGPLFNTSSAHDPAVLYSFR